MTVVEHLYADQFGSFVGKYAERLKLTHQGQVLQQAPLLHLKSVTIANSGISISADAIAACCERGIPIVMLDSSGYVYAAIYASGLVGTVQTRRQQLLAFYDERRAALAVAFSTAKVRNQAATLYYWARNRAEAYPHDAQTLTQAAQDIGALADRMTALPVQDILYEQLMGFEGQAAHLYWQSARCLVPEHYAFTGRSGRGARDPVNSLINYGYGILYAEIERAILFSGLDPYAGFLHEDRSGKPSLVLDLIEEFRQIVVDRPVFGLVARSYTVNQDENGLLAADTRRDFAKKILTQLEGRVRYAGERLQLRHLIQRQARQLATYVRGERPDYMPFILED
jgi:CRISPR-associated protein Cas1